VRVGDEMTAASWWKVLAAELEREKERDKRIQKRWAQARRNQIAWSISQVWSYDWGAVLSGEKHRLQTRSKMLMLRVWRALDQAERKRLESVLQRVLQRLRIGYATECANKNMRRGQVMRQLKAEAERQRRRIVMPLFRSVARARKCWWLGMSTHLVLSWRTQMLQERMRRDRKQEMRDGERLRVLASVRDRALMSRLLSRSVTQLRLGAMTRAAARSAVMARAVDASAGALVRRVWLQLVGEFAHSIEHKEQQTGWSVMCEKKRMPRGLEVSEIKASRSARTVYDWRCGSCVGGYWNVAGSPSCAKCTYETHVLCEQKDRWTGDDAGKLCEIQELKGRWVTAHAANRMVEAERGLLQEVKEREEQRVRAEVWRALNDNLMMGQPRKNNPMHACEYMRVPGRWKRVVQCARNSAGVWAQALQAVQQRVLEDKVATCRVTAERAKLKAAVKAADMAATEKAVETADLGMAKAEATNAEAVETEATKAAAIKAAAARAATTKAASRAIDRAAACKAAMCKVEAASSMAAFERAAADKAAAERASACKAAERRATTKAEAEASKAAAERAACEQQSLIRVVLTEQRAKETTRLIRAVMAEQVRITASEAAAKRAACEQGMLQTLMREASIERVTQAREADWAVT
jgi:hypothetical protein